MCTDNGEPYRQTTDRAARYAHLRRTGEATMGGEARDAVTHNIERRDRLTFLWGREGRRWQAKDGAVRQEMHEPSAGFSPYKTRPSPLGSRNLRARDQVARHDEGHARVRRLDPGPECLPGLGRLQRALGPGPDRQSLRRHDLLADRSNETGEPRDHEFQCGLNVG